MMIQTSFKLLHEARACKERYRFLAKVRGERRLAGRMRGPQEGGNVKMDRRKYREELLMECWQVIEGLLWIAPIWGGIIDAMILHDANKLLAKLEKEAGIERKQRDYACTNTTEKRGAVDVGII